MIYRRGVNIEYNLTNMKTNLGWFWIILFEVAF